MKRSVLSHALLLSLVPMIPLSALAEHEGVPHDAQQQTSHTWRASKLIGATVKNTAGETVGKIDDVLVDGSNGKVVSVIVSTGGFLGMGDTLSAVPWSALAHHGETVTTRLTKEELGKLTHFKSSEWSTISSEDLKKKLREARDSVGGDVNAPDNTARNERDVQDDKLTPLDQGNSETDVALTKDLRSALVASDLSFNAKNIKIITKDGHVTLRGVVESDAERDAILKLAESKVEKARITNELESKKN
jgi:osmotically-inducible protein OsmY